jgi:hypothetical protein
MILTWTTSLIMILIYVKKYKSKEFRI